MNEQDNQAQLRTERLAACPLRNCPSDPDEEMTLRGIRSGRLLCTKCAIPTPTGYIAKEMARAHDDKFFKGTHQDYVIAVLVCGLGMALICGILVYTRTVLMIDWYIAVAVATGAGGLLTEAALQLSKRRRGRYSDLLGAASTAIGGGIGAFIGSLLLWGTLDMALQMTFANVPLIIFIAIAAATVYARFKVRI